MSLSKQVNNNSGNDLLVESKLAVSLLKSIWQKSEFSETRKIRVKS